MLQMLTLYAAKTRIAACPLRRRHCMPLLNVVRDLLTAGPSAGAG